jgi:hypothetical protein
MERVGVIGGFDSAPPTAKESTDEKDDCAKGSRRNKFTILDVEAPDRQGAEAQEYQAYFELPQRSRTGWIDSQNVKLFLSEP